MSGLPFALSEGAIPMGRWTVTPWEAEEFSRMPSAERRGKLWKDWVTAVSIVRAVAGGVSACWLGGSYFTDKPEPGDIDSVFVVDAARLRHVSDPASRQLLASINDGALKRIGLEVDGFILPWMPEDGTSRGHPTRRAQYLESRGYWDDLWCRRRDSDTRLDAVPRRGYLEVIVDGYA